MGSMGQEEEMLKQVQHDSLVCVDSLVRVRCDYSVQVRHGKVEQI